MKNIKILHKKPHVLTKDEIINDWNNENFFDSSVELKKGDVILYYTMGMDAVSPRLFFEVLEDTKMYSPDIDEEYLTNDCGFIIDTGDGETFISLVGEPQQCLLEEIEDDEFLEDSVDIIKADAEKYKPKYIFVEP